VPPGRRSVLDAVEASDPGGAPPRPGHASVQPRRADAVMGAIGA